MRIPSCRTMAVTAAAVVVLAGCSNGPTTTEGNDPAPGASTTATPGSPSGTETTPGVPEVPTAPPTVPIGPEGPEYCANQKPSDFTGSAAEHFGAANVRDAFCEMIKFVVTNTYTREIMTPRTDYRPIEFSFIEKYLTPSLANEWRSNVRRAVRALNKGKEVKKEVGYKITPFMIFNVQYLGDGAPGAHLPTVEEGPVSSGHKWGPANLELVEYEGHKQLKLTFTVKSDLHFQNETTLVTIPAEKTTSYYLVENPGNPDIPWLIEGYSDAVAEYGEEQLTPIAPAAE